MDNRSAVVVMVHHTQHNKASFHLKRLDCVGFSDISGISTTRLVVGVSSALVEKEFLLLVVADCRWLPLSSMSRFSLLQIDVEVEEPETSENPTQLLRFIISSGGAHRLWP